MIPRRIAIAAMTLFFVEPAAGEDIICSADGVPDGAIELQETIVPDLALSTPEQVFGYIALLTPAGWRAEGGLGAELADSCGYTEKLRWRTQSPDGASSIDVLPTEGWTASASKAQFSACSSRDIFSAGAYVEDLMKRNGMAAITLASRPRPDIVAPLQKADLGGGGSFSADAVEMQVTFAPATGSTEAGRDGLVFAAILIFTPSLNIPEYESRASSLPTLVARAPAGALNRDLVEAVRASAILNPNWARVRERMAPPGIMPVPDRKDDRWRRPEPFPMRVAGARATACGMAFDALTAPGVFRSEDGRYWYLPQLNEALAVTPEQR